MLCNCTQRTCSKNSTARVPCPAMMSIWFEDGIKTAFGSRRCMICVAASFLALREREREREREGEREGGREGGKGREREGGRERGGEREGGERERER